VPAKLLRISFTHRTRDGANAQIAHNVPPWHAMAPV